MNKLNSFSLAALLSLAACSPKAPPVAATPPPPPTCPGDNGGLSLAPGFCATIFADNLGHARHMAVSPEGVVYVNTWSGLYFGFDKLPEGGFLVALQDTNGDGKADKIDALRRRRAREGHGRHGHRAVQRRGVRRAE